MLCKVGVNEKRPLFSVFFDSHRCVLLVMRLNDCVILVVKDSVSSRAIMLHLLSEMVKR